MAVPIYRRVIVKLSGEALSGPEGFGIHQPTIDRYAADIVAARASWRDGRRRGRRRQRAARRRGRGAGRVADDRRRHGHAGDGHEGLVLEAAIERAGASARTMSALTMPQVCETYERARALRHLDENRVVIFAGGTGNPFFTTDTTAVLRAAEMNAATPFSRPPMSTASIPPTRKRTRPRSAMSA